MSGPGGRHLAKQHFEIGQTAVSMIAEPRFLAIGKEAIFEARQAIERFIASDPLFRDTLEPYDEPDDAHPLIKRMCDAARKAEVGPMAAVAGAIAEFSVQAMLDGGSDHAVVENGGDIALLLAEETNVGIYTLNPKFRGLGFRCLPSDSILGICTSSGLIGPSISFGKAEAATVVSRNVALADACATRLGNLVQGDDEEAIEAALDLIASIDGVNGAMVIVGDSIGLKGALPELVKVEFDDEAVTGIRFPNR
ncbi:MAG: UPF0280 family protein [Methanomassiliicoccales archaeon]|nr:UPF0280 family protein [Methanomassiliicoccales archaeon]